MTITKHDVVERAIEILQENELCSGSYARDPYGLPVHVESDDAREFCAVGAIARAAHDLDYRFSDDEAVTAVYMENLPGAVEHEFHTDFARLLGVLHGGPVILINWSDARDRDQVVAGLRELARLVA